MSGIKKGREGEAIVSLPQTSRFINIYFDFDHLKKNNDNSGYEQFQACDFVASNLILAKFWQNL